MGHRPHEPRPGPVLFAAGMVILLAMTRPMPMASRHPRLAGALGRALSNSRAWAPLLGGALVAGITAGTIIGYLFLPLRSLGASALTMGLALVIATASEIVAFSMADRVIRRLGIGRTLLLGIGAGVVRLLIFGLVPTIGWALVTQLLHGFTFSLPLSAGVMGAAKLSPKGLGTTGQGVFSAVFLGLGPTVGVILAGYLLGQTSEQTMMLTMAIVVLVAGAIVALPLLRSSEL